MRGLFSKKYKMDEHFYRGIKSILEFARNKAYQAVNFAMVEAYWEIGKRIVEEQGGPERAEYGRGLIKELSEKMTRDFGKGFTIANLKNMRQFYMDEAVKSNYSVRQLATTSDKTTSDFSLCNQPDGSVVYP